MLIEISYPLSPSSPKWPTNPDEEYFSVAEQKNGDVSTTASVYHHLHNGTHIDAPKHFDMHGLTIDQLPIEDFYFERPFVLKLDKKPGEMVTLEDIAAFMEEIRSCDLLMIYTGHSIHRESDPQKFMENFPFLSPELARCIRKELLNIKGLALDVLSVDSAVLGIEMGFPAHHALLETNEAFPERTVRIFEDVNIGKLIGYKKVRSVSAFPVRWIGLEAAPAAIVAQV